MFPYIAVGAVVLVLWIKLWRTEHARAVRPNEKETFGGEWEVPEGPSEASGGEECGGGEAGGGEFFSCGGEG